MLDRDDRLCAFRDEIRRFIDESLPASIRRKVAAEQMDLPREDQLEWHRRLLERGGWCCPSWPREHGGPGWSFEQQYAFERELALGDAPRLLIYGVGMLGPTLMAHGTEAQKARHLPAILRGDVMWCQGFSEPNAGSDLAALECRAVRDAGHYVLEGLKLWTSEAHIADWMFGLFRTERGERKQHGITFLMLDLRSPGVTVRPLLTFDGTHEVNQVFLEGVRVPVENRIGAPGEGWGIAKYLLGLERFGTAEISRTMASLRRLERLVAADPMLAADRRLRDEVTAAAIELRALELTERRFLFGAEGPNALGPEASLLKVRGTELQQRVLGLTVEALGHHALVDSPLTVVEGADPVPGTPPEAARAARNYFNYRKTSIYSGSNEIQKNIIAKAVLGL